MEAEDLRQVHDGGTGKRGIGDGGAWSDADGRHAFSLAG
jgi:hypothetical protein